MSECYLVKSHGLLAVFCLVLGLAGAASAQDRQTQENAQLFLAQVVGQGATTLAVDVGGGWNKFAEDRYFCRFSPYYMGNFRIEDWKCGNDYLEWNEYPKYKASGARAEIGASGRQNCATVIATDSIKGFNDERIYKGQVDNSSYTTVTTRRLPASPFTLDWSKAAEVKQDGSSVSVMGIKPALKFYLPSEALAARVAYAMEFLRTNCDATSGTGF